MQVKLMGLQLVTDARLTLLYKGIICVAVLPPSTLVLMDTPQWEVVVDELRTAFRNNSQSSFTVPDNIEVDAMIGLDVLPTHQGIVDPDSPAMVLLPRKTMPSITFHVNARDTTPPIEPTSIDDLLTCQELLASHHQARKNLSPIPENVHLGRTADRANIAIPLNLLTVEGHFFAWTTEFTQAFSVLKDALTSATILVFPNGSVHTPPFILDTDASTFPLAQSSAKPMRTDTNT
ncbi:unnamed protein product [Schistocephalus solidus]|uniref:Reverse transcriptase domain-containing protein n=1 Tax=Schistocephalus solidus TaxID=70667 RepID=A0A183T4Z4_SCHSO|nr:unnamed protein product [Schistocephalus solidus]